MAQADRIWDASIQEAFLVDDCNGSSCDYTIHLAIAGIDLRYSLNRNFAKKRCDDYQLSSVASSRYVASVPVRKFLPEVAEYVCQGDSLQIRTKIEKLAC